jgi:hypothetical protein
MTYVIERVDENDVMWSLHKQVMYRVIFVVDDGYDYDYDYIADEEIVKYLDKWFENR